MFQRVALLLALLILAVSALVPACSALASRAQQPHTYTVQPGDTLTTIAAKVGLTSWQRLYAANRDRIGNPHVLRVGQVLVIPDMRASVSYLPILMASPGAARGPSVATGDAPAPYTATDDTTAPAEPGPAPATVPIPAGMRLTIPAIGLDTAPVPVGHDRANRPVVPKHDVGWYTHSAMPGQGENVVFWGHVAR
jgi:LysM repeat protein